MRIIFVFLLFFSLEGFAQCKSYVISSRGDTLNCVDMKDKKQGPWIIKEEALRGEPGFEEEGYYADNLKDGLWRRYSLQGDLVARENYKWGNKHGQCIYYTQIGELVREEYWRAVNPANPYDTVPVYDVNDPSKIIEYAIVKVEGTTLKHGTWRYYDEYGQVFKSEEWFLDKPKNAADAEGTDDELAPIDVTTGKKKDAKPAGPAKKPQAILDYEKKNAGKKKIKVRDGQTGIH
jgi:hypothetical protein